MEIIDTIDTKTKFIVLHALTDITSKQISEALGIPYSTARDWTTKTDENIDIRIIAEGRGKKPEITEETKRKIARDVRMNMNQQKFSTNKLASKHEMSNSKVFDTLKEKGFIFGRYDIPQNLTDIERDSRVEFCKLMLDDENRIYETFFSDESGFKLSDAHVERICKKENKEMELELPREHVRSLHIFKENLKGPIYQNILGERREEVDTLYPWGGVILFMIVFRLIRAVKTG